MIEEAVVENTKDAVKGNMRVEDQLKLRELELQTQYELKYLTTSFEDLRRFVEGKLDTESSKFKELNKRVSLLTYIILAQLAGFDAPALLSLLKNLPF